MKEQNYSNHRRYIIGYHGVTTLLLIILLLSSIYNLYVSFKIKTDIRAAIMFFIITLILMSMFIYYRAFSTKAQDRAVRAEENLRHFVLTGKLMDPKLTLSQIIALRFSPDEEFLELSQKAAKDNLSSDDIKKSIKTWKADHYRV